MICVDVEMNRFSMMVMMVRRTDPRGIQI
jgi:hypothetical protein